MCNPQSSRFWYRNPKYGDWLALRAFRNLRKSEGLCEGLEIHQSHAIHINYLRGILGTLHWITEHFIEINMLIKQVCQSKRVTEKAEHAYKNKEVLLAAFLDI